jgi:hypothetical protein
VKEAGGAEHPPLPAPLTLESAPPTFGTPAAAPKVAPLISPPEATAAPETLLAAPTVAPVVTPVTPAPMTAPATRASTSAAFEPWVFISHSSKDEAFGQRLTASLRAALPPNEAGRARVWYDQAPERGREDTADAGGALEPGGLTVGMDYPTEIAEQIAARTVIVVVLSPEAARSRWVKYELSQSVRRYNGSERVLICPLIYRACVTPNSIGIFQTLDFQGADGDGALYQRQVAELVARLSDGRWPLSESAPPFEVGALPPPARLVGRDEHLEWVVDRLRAGGATAITALGGLGGIGKSALAAVAIRRLRAEGAFPDGIVVVGCELETDAVKILRAAIERFLPGQRALDAATLPALASAALKELEGKRALVVLDNVEPGLAVAEVCGPLKEAGVTLLLTARQTPPDTVVPADGVRRLELLDAAHALAVFTQTYRGPDADPAALSAEERAAAERIVTAVDRHTLAVRLAGSQAAERVAYVPMAQRGSVLAAVAAGIERDMLGILDGDTSRKVEMVLRLSVDALPPDGRWLFTALAAFATGEFGRQAAIALARGLGLANPEDSVDLLIRRAARSQLRRDAGRSRACRRRAPAPAPAAARAGAQAPRRLA